MSNSIVDVLQDMVWAGKPTPEEAANSVSQYQEMSLTLLQIQPDWHQDQEEQQRWSEFISHLKSRVTLMEHKGLGQFDPFSAAALTMSATSSGVNIFKALFGSGPTKEQKQNTTYLQQALQTASIVGAKLSTPQQVIRYIFDYVTGNEGGACGSYWCPISCNGAEGRGCWAVAPYQVARNFGLVYSTSNPAYADFGGGEKIPPIVGPFFQALVKDNSFYQKLGTTPNDAILQYAKTINMDPVTVASQLGLGSLASSTGMNQQTLVDIFDWILAIPETDPNFNPIVTAESLGFPASNLTGTNNDAVTISNFFKAKIQDPVFWQQSGIDPNQFINYYVSIRPTLQPAQQIQPQPQPPVALAPSTIPSTSLIPSTVQTPFTVGPVGPLPPTSQFLPQDITSSLANIPVWVYVLLGIALLRR